MKRVFELIIAFLILVLTCVGVSGATYKYVSKNDKEVINAVEVKVEVPKYPDNNGKLEVNTEEYYFSNFKNKLYYYNQNDYSDVKYGIYGTIKSHGCGPTSMAMVISSFKNQKITPIETTNYACLNNYCTKGGTDLEFFKSIGNSYGLNVEGLLLTSDKNNQIKILESLMSNEKLVIIRAFWGYFYNGSHYILLAGIRDGEILVMDPYSREKSIKYSFGYLMSLNVNPRYAFIINEK